MYFASTIRIPYVSSLYGLGICRAFSNSSYQCTTFQGHICNNIHFDTPFFILPTVLRDKDDSLRNFFPSQTIQPFIYCAIVLFISGLPLNGWACQPFIAEGFGPGRGFISRLYFTCFSALCIRFLKGYFYFPTLAGKVLHNCGAASPQLRGRYTAVVGQ